MNNEPFVSILTPVFNGEKYLEECILSVLSQNYSNWEYVIVNNKSTDKTGEIIQRFAETESRIRIHNNADFLPVMDNLNHTFRQMSPGSKYCKVIHADDLMFPDCLTRMVEVAERYPKIGIVNSYRIAGQRVGPMGLIFPENYFTGREISRKFLLDNSNFFSAPSNLLIRSDLIRKRNSVYNPSYLQSDLSACLDLLSESDFGFVHQILTFTRRHNQSVTETLAKRYYTYMLGSLKMVQDFGQQYLTEEEFGRALSQRIHFFYIQFARNVLKLGFKSSYERHKMELESVNIPFNQIKFAGYMVREFAIKVFNIFGFQLKKTF